MQGQQGEPVAQSGCSDEEEGAGRSHQPDSLGSAGHVLCGAVGRAPSRYQLLALSPGGGWGWKSTLVSGLYRVATIGDTLWDCCATTASAIKELTC